MDDLIDAINGIYRDADKDPEFRNWFRRLDSYIRRCLKTQGHILTDEANREWDALYDDGNFLFRERYREHTDRLINEAKFLIDQFAQDPESKELGNSVQKLFTDLGSGDDGKITFKKHLVKDVMNVIIPDIFEDIRYVPVPRIEYSDPMVDAVIENLVIESDNLMPNLFEISNDSYFRWGRKDISKAHRQSFIVSIAGIQCDFRDVSYYINRKQGFPSITDTGVADFLLGGNGLGLKLHLTAAHKHDRAHFFQCEKVDVTISNLSVKLKQSKHKLLFTILKPLLLTVMRPVIQKVVAKQIQDYFVRMDAFAWCVHQEQEKAKREAASDPENASNVCWRYVEAIRSEILRKKGQVKQVVEGKEMKLVMIKENSLERFKNIVLAGGISTKASEFKEMGRKGDKWYSDVFSIGSAPETPNIPVPKPITHKSPHAQQANVRDRPAAQIDTTSPTPAGHSVASRASRDSGYHGIDPVGVNTGTSKPEMHTRPDTYSTDAAPPPTDLTSKLEERDLGSTGNNLAGKYNLKAPLGQNPMRQTSPGRDTSTAATTEAGYYPEY